MNKFDVLLPYEITLLSNFASHLHHFLRVLLPYEITLLSNSPLSEPVADEFYYLMKLHYSQTIEIANTDTEMFYYLMKLHYSQTRQWNKSQTFLFYYLMKLHYSQTQQTPPLI